MMMVVVVVVVVVVKKKKEEEEEALIQYSSLDIDYLFYREFSWTEKQ
jgi:hypothetical protein